MTSNFRIEKLIRPHLLGLQPYRSARDLFTGKNAILLDANESAFGSPIKGKMDFSRYPDPRQTALRKSVSKLLQIPADNIFFGVGSDEIIDLLVKLLCEPVRDNTVIIEPSYGMYRTVCDINNVSITPCRLENDFSVSAAKVLNAVTKRTKIIFLCSPNNPTGNLIDKQTIRTICASFNGIVVVDEAYIDFAGANASISDEIETLPNLAVLRTFSKAWGLASVRLGYILTNKVLIDWLFKIKAPYSINKLTESTVLKALRKRQIVQSNIGLVLKEGEALCRQFRKIDWIENIYPSRANFILIRIKHSEFVRQSLEKAGIVIRSRNNEPMLKGCLRITIGTKAENNMLIKAINRIVKKGTPQ